MREIISREAAFRHALRRFWYQWFMTLDEGAGAVRADPKGFARIQWDTWSPSGWFDEIEFETTAKSFESSAQLVRLPA
jgi:hypothetical protein